MDKRVKKSLRGEYLYYPQDVIGEGGYAVVYKGEKISTKSTVAIKKISFGTPLLMQIEFQTTMPIQRSITKLEY